MLEFKELSETQPSFDSIGIYMSRNTVVISSPANRCQFQLAPGTLD